MKRTLLLKLGLLLLLGAIINVAVAWGVLQHLFTVRSSTELTDSRRDQLWKEHGSIHSFPPIDGTAMAERWIRFGSTFEHVVIQIPLPPSGREDFVAGEIFTGLPCRSMWGTIAVQHTIPVVPRDFGLSKQTWYEGFIKLPFKEQNNPQIIAGYLPIRIAWPGFAFNTIFYAAIVWLLLFIPGKVRRWRRIRRGLCPACAYPVGTSDKCTECGKLKAT